MTAPAASLERARHGMGQARFVALIASLMAVNALAIDSMLPALPTIATSLGLASSNGQQWIVTAYLLGFGGAQIVYGPLADRFGRKPALLAGLAIYVACSAAAGLSTSFGMLLAARVVQGVGAAATRVLSVSIVRDCYSGREMARIMSFTFLVFLAVPIIAPTAGQVIMLFGPWRWIFGALTLLASAILAWAALQLPETLDPRDRIPIDPRHLAGALRAVVTDRVAMGYMLAMTMMLGGLFGFINSAQQVFAGVFGAPRLFTVIFATVAAAMAVASLVNARLVNRMGPRGLSHAALLAYIACSLGHAAFALAGAETLPVFTVIQSAMMFAFGLVVPNFGALAMGPLGHVAGIGSSVQGFVTTFGGALLGSLVGQSFNGTLVPLALGFAGYGALALLFVMLAEQGRLFRPAPAGLTPAGNAPAAH